MKRLLLTGATGFIGGHALHVLATGGYEVYAVSPTRQQIECPGVNWIQTDLLDEVLVRELICRVKPTHLLHFAWYSSPGKYWTSLENLSWLQASIELLRSFAEYGGQRAVFAGSCAEYDWNYGYCSEFRTPLQPSTLYGTCKHTLQQVADAFCKQERLNYAWGRIFFVYGPNEDPNRLVSGAITTLIKGESFNCSHGTQIRDFLHVTDIAGAFAALLDSKVQGPVNIASGIPVTIREVVSTIGRKLNGENLIRWGALPIPPDEPPLVLADARRLRDEVQWEPTYDLDAGLEQTIAWWKKRISKADE